METAQWRRRYPYAVYPADNRAFVTEGGTIPERTLGLTIGRWIHDGMHEDIDVTNNSMNPVKFQLEIGIRSDFADIFEVKSNRIVRRGRITTDGRRHDGGSSQAIATEISGEQWRLTRRERQERRPMPMDD